MDFISAKARLRSLVQQRGTLMNTAEPLSQCQIASHQNSTQSTTRGLESAPPEHESTTAATESPAIGDDERLSFCCLQMKQQELISVSHRLNVHLHLLR